MDAITAILDGNIYRVEENSSSQMTIDSDGAFDEVYNTISDESDLDAIFNWASEQTGVDVNLLKAVAQAESGFDTNAVSSGGAMGIMQLMPATCSDYGVADPFDVSQNILGGAKVLSWMLDRYDGDLTLTLAAYNSGYGNVDKNGGVPPFSQTTSYINKVKSIYNSYNESVSSELSNNLYNLYANGYNRFL